MGNPHPYENLVPSAFWRSAVSETHPLEFSDLYKPKFSVSTRTKVAAAGSCFAQHIGRQFKNRKLDFIDVEPPPAVLPTRQWHEFGYDLYSGRYGNIYTPRQLVQLVKRAYGAFLPSDAVWESESRWYDPYRPTIEPRGFSCVDELERLRTFHLAGVRKIIESCDLFIFTFGLTEAWVNTRDGAVYPTCPGTAAGTFDPALHQFVNFGFNEILADTEEFISLVRSRNPGAKFLFTVSPVPLVATASGQHVLTASIYSKSVLRSACGELDSRHDFVDYFPSYEIAASHPFRGMFYEPNLRTITPRGVEHIMHYFFQAHFPSESESPMPTARRRAAGGAARQDKGGEDTVCDEEILEVFGR